MILKPTSEWSDPITLPKGFSILRVNSGDIQLVFGEAPDGDDDGQKLAAGASVSFGFLIPPGTIRIKASNPLRETEVYLGPWWG